MRRILRLPALLSVLAAIDGTAPDAALGEALYFGNSQNSIERINVDGSARQTLVTGQNLPLGLAADLAHDKIVWVDLGGNDIRRANLDGTSQQTLVTGLHGPIDIALDVASGKMYWTEYSGHAIKQANLDGSNVQTIVSSPMDFEGLALDLVAGKIYWSNDLGQIQRANLNGSSIETIIPAGSAPGNFEVRVDPLAGKLFWSVDTDFDPMNPMPNSGQIWRSNLDGMSPQLIVSGLDHPLGMAIGHAAGLMYWTNTGTGDIRSANLDGSGASVFSRA